MKKFRMFSLMLIFIMMGSIIFAGGVNESKKENGNTQTPSIKTTPYVWGSASLGSAGYVIIEALVSTVNKYEKSFRNASISTQGGTENVVLLSQGQIDFGQATSNALYDGYNGLSPFTSKVDFAQVMSYAYWAFPIGVPENSSIKKIEDLNGKKLSVGPAGGATQQVVMAAIKEYGINVTPVYLSWAESVNAFKTGQVDAATMLFVNGTNLSPAFVELIQTHPFRLINMDSQKIKNASKKNNGILQANVQWDGQTIIASGNSGILAADPKIDEDVIYKICKSLFENEESVRKIAKVELAFFSLENALEMIIPEYPIHKGAAKYYKEKGLWKDNYVIYE